METQTHLATILDGTKIAAEIKDEVAAQVRELLSHGIRPGLAAVLAGNNPASEIYVRNKVKTCEQLGIYSEKISPADSVTTAEMLDLVESLNRRDDIDGILVQLPLPPQVDSKRVLLAVSPEKDVDGFHPLNVGYLSTQRPGLTPCTPAGVIEILNRGGIEISGRDAVVLGRSDIVGKPVAMMLLNNNATVMVCHSRTPDLATHTRRADILVAAIGKAAMVTPEMVRPGATVIDVGINRVMDKKKVHDYFGNDPKRQEEFTRKGSTLVGDVHPRVAEVAGAITPVPGGVGPLTIAMLMSNTVKAARMRRGLAVQ
jgi:methylenetetrahydrofolate dehydrogenase (NADP+)/methenyltetrahydrofolate cyclohydrolase